MKTIGLVGGVSWESTRTYYGVINTLIKERLGSLHSARIVLVSVDLQEIMECVYADDWDGVAARLSKAAQQVEAGGAEGLFLCSNTMHLTFSKIREAVSIPCFHITDATGAAIAADGRQSVALIGTRYTMEQPDISARLKERFGIETIIPNEQEREMITRIILEELCLGEIRDDSRKKYIAVMERLASEGAEGAILGCTEIELLVKPEHTAIPLYDTTSLHAAVAVDWALGEN